jgi:hypothetical protein
MENFMKGQHSIHNVPPFDKDNLSFVNNSISHRLQSDCKALSKSFIQAIQKADMPELIYFLSFFDFREKSDNAIV